METVQTVLLFGGWNLPKVENIHKYSFQSYKYKGEAIHDVAGGRSKEYWESNWVLLKRFRVLAEPSRLWFREEMTIVIQACVIIHNIIVEERKEGYTGNGIGGRREHIYELFDAKREKTAGWSDTGGVSENPESQVQIAETPVSYLIAPRVRVACSLCKASASHPTQGGEELSHTYHLNPMRSPVHSP